MSVVSNRPRARGARAWRRGRRRDTRSPSASRTPRSHYRGTLDHVEILQSFHPTGPTGMGDPVPQIERGGLPVPEQRHGAVTTPDARPGEIAAWGVGELVPWLLAAVASMPRSGGRSCVTAERADPFQDSADDAGWP